MNNISVSTKVPVRYKDLDLSFLPNPMTGDLRTKSDAAAIAQSIRRLIFGRINESPFQPLKGTNLSSLLFELDSPFLRLELTDMIRYTIVAFEPRVSFLGVSFFDANNPNTLGVRIYYIIKGGSETFVDLNLRRTR